MTESTGRPADARPGGPVPLTDDERVGARAALGRDPTEVEAVILAAAWSDRRVAGSIRPLLDALPAPSEARPLRIGRPGVVPLTDGSMAVVSVVSAPLDDVTSRVLSAAFESAAGDVIANGARPVAVLVTLSSPPPDPDRARLLGANVHEAARLADALGCRLAAPQVAIAAGTPPHFAAFTIGVRPAAVPGPSGDRPRGSAPVPHGGDALLLLVPSSITEAGALARAANALAERGLALALVVVAAGGIVCAAADAVSSAGGGAGVHLDLDAVASAVAPRAVPWATPVAEPVIPDAILGVVLHALVALDSCAMLAVVPPGRVDAAVSACRQAGVSALVIGRVTEDAMVTVLAHEGAADAGSSADRTSGATLLADIPIAALDAPGIPARRRAEPPTRRRHAPAPGAPVWASDRLPIRGMDPGAVLRGLLGSPELGSRGPLAGLAPIQSADAAVTSVDIGAAPSLVCAADGGAGVRPFDPRLSAALAIASAARAVVLAGAQPALVAVSLQAGDPADPEALWLVSDALRGLADASRGLGLTVATVQAGLASPTFRRLPSTQVAVIGQAIPGLVPAAGRFAAPDDLVALLGDSVPGLAGSAYACLAGAAADERLPTLDIDRERGLHRLLLEAAREGILSGARSVGGGGAAVALALCAIAGGIGARLSMRVSAEPAVELFGESPSRAVVTVSPNARERLQMLARHHDVPVEWLGRVGGERLQVGLVGGGAAGAAEERGASVADAIDCGVAELRHAWEHALDRLVAE